MIEEKQLPEKSVWCFCAPCGKVMPLRRIGQRKIADIYLCDVCKKSMLRIEAK